ncbi:MAG TPA: hypothetical protein VHF47_09070 [Acidimicrobiales bacterium]|nr:hypothetical protein [Acidimicrobiales bacterium]
MYRGTTAGALAVLVWRDEAGRDGCVARVTTVLDLDRGDTTSTVVSGRSEVLAAVDAFLESFVAQRPE